MTEDSPDLPEGSSPGLVADYVIDLLRSMAALLDSADLQRSSAALKAAVPLVREESLAAQPAETALPERSTQARPR
mgnify:CR=1 FL=1